MTIAKISLHCIFKFNQKAWLKPYIDVKMELTKKAKNYFEKYFFEQMNNVVFRKSMENVSNHRNIKLVTTESRTSYLVFEQTYHTTNFFFLKIY